MGCALAVVQLWTGEFIRLGFGPPCRSSLVLLICSVATWSCSTASRPKESLALEVSEDTTQRLIADTASMAVFPLDTSSVVMVWNLPYGTLNAELSLDELNLIENIIDKRVNEFMARLDSLRKVSPDSRGRIDPYVLSRQGYRRQIVAGVAPDGEKYVLVNATSTETPDWGWRTNFSIPEDGGGSCYVLWINLTKGICYDFRVGSVA